MEKPGFLKCLAGVLICAATAQAQDSGRPTRESRIDRSLLRDNELFAQAGDASHGMSNDSERHQLPDAPGPYPEAGDAAKPAPAPGAATNGAAATDLSGAPPDHSSEARPAMGASAPSAAKPPAAAAAASTSPGSSLKMRAATATDVAKIRALDRRYQKAKSVAMDMTKRLKLSALGRERTAHGRLLVSKGRMRMEIDAPDKSLVVIDGKTAWLVNYPSDDFKGSALQVIKADVSSKRAKSQALVGLLAQGGFLKCFKIVGTLEGKVFFLQPNSDFTELQRAQATLTDDGKDLASLRYWDELGNETDYEFSKTKLDVAAPGASFKYQPPKDADITVM